MTQTTDKSTDRTAPVASPHPGLQAVLPRLKSIGTNSESRPVFDDPEEVQEHLDSRDDASTFYVVPVWAINHTDLTSSEVVNWSYTRWLN